VIENLKSIVFAVLNRVAAHVQFCEECKVFDECKLAYLANVVQLDPQETKAFTVL